MYPFPRLFAWARARLKFTWKWRINLSHLSMLTPSNSTGPIQVAVSILMKNPVYV